jgi:dihydrofolate synthase / folylpolyglutamate synthase
MLTPLYSYLDKISFRGVQPSLDRIQKAVALLDHPEKKYKIIHIAGTNGKGSTCHFIAQLLAKNGYQVGLTLSPHVDDYRERIQISDSQTDAVKKISPEKLLETHDFLLSRLGENHSLTYFEWTILLALQFFAQSHVDFVVLETGLGGRWDASNVVAESFISGITSVGLDHMDYLGNSLDEILVEKIQIIKPHSHFVMGPLQESLNEMAFKHCQKNNVPYYSVSDLVDVFHDVSLDDDTNQYFKEALRFTRAVANLLNKKGFSISFEKLCQSKIMLPPARFEVMCQDPIIIRDGAHNQPALERLKSFVDQRWGKEYDLVFGCLKNRDFIKLAQIIQSPHTCYWARFDGGRQTTQELVYENARQELGGEVVSLDQDFKRKINTRCVKRPLVICGSFYLCAQFKKMWEQVD